MRPPHHKLRSASASFAMLLVFAQGLSGCLFDDVEEGPVLLVPEDIALHWDESFNQTDDMRAALIPVDLMAYDGMTGEPLAFVDLDLESLSADIGFFSPEVVVPLESWEAADRDVLWDVWRDRYFLVESSDGWPRDRIEIETDASGLARVVLFADAFTESESGFEPASVVVSMGLMDEPFLLVPR